jgi:hypothetical protein
MATVIGVRFKNAGKLYFFHPGALWPSAGDYVIVETARGVEFGEVVTGVREIDDDQIIAPLKQVIRIASADDIQHAQENEKNEREAYAVCQRKITEHKLDMKLVSVEYTFDNSKILFYFTANGRVDFRSLVKDLASVFKTRIELCIPSACIRLDEAGNKAANSAIKARIGNHILCDYRSACIDRDNRYAQLVQIRVTCDVRRGRKRCRSALFKVRNNAPISPVPLHYDTVTSM